MLYSLRMMQTLPVREFLMTDEIARLDQKLTQQFSKKLVLQPALTRSLVSFQANKTRPVYRWYKYKEAFSAGLVEFLFGKYDVARGTIFDPFAGSGTALFVASEMGMNAEGIELLPIGQQIIATKKLVEQELTHADLERIKNWADECAWHHAVQRGSVAELRITHGAYPQATHEAIEYYLGALTQENARVQQVLRFALLCVGTSELHAQRWSVPALGFSFGAQARQQTV